MSWFRTAPPLICAFLLAFNYPAPTTCISSSLFCTNFVNHEFLEYSSKVNLLEPVLAKFYAELTTPSKTVVVVQQERNSTNRSSSDNSPATTFYLLNFPLKVTIRTDMANTVDLPNECSLFNKSRQDSTFILIWDNNMDGLSDFRIPHQLRSYNHKYFGVIWRNWSTLWKIGVDEEAGAVGVSDISLRRMSIDLLCDDPSRASHNLNLGQVFISNLYGSGTLGKCLNPLYDGVNYCWMDMRVIANLMIHFNFTPSIMGPNHTANDTGKPIGTTSNVIFQESAYSVLTASNPSFQFYYLRAIQAKYISYCDPRSAVIRPLDVSLKIWLAPFHSVVWVTLALSLLLLKVFGLQRVLGKYFQVSNIASLYVRLGQFLGLTFVVILAGYESYVTTSDIIPPESHVFSNVRDLIDNGYKLYHYEGSNNPMQQGLNVTYFYDLQRYLTPGTDIGEWFHVVQGPRYEDAWPLYLNLTRTERIGNINWEMYKEWDVVNMEKANGRHVNCHTIPTPFNHEKSYWLFQGPFRWDFVRGFDELVTSGIVGWWDTNGLYWDALHNHADIVREAEVNNKRTGIVKPISFRHKFTSIFPITGYLFLFSVLTLTVELICVKLGDR